MSEVTTQDIARAMTNDPALAKAEFQLGDKTITIVDLAYDDYVLFMSHLKPLLEAVVNKIAGAAGLDNTNTAMGVADLLQYCTTSIPDMALLVARQTEPDITVEELKKLGKTPFKLAGLVFKQIEQNRVIEEIGDFFVQILPLLPIRRQK